MMDKQPWIGKPLADILFILSPPFLSLLLIFLFPGHFQDNQEMPVAAWIVLVLLIDVAHVYSTLYRTYFDPYALQHQRSLLWSIPLIGFVVGVMLYSINDLLFWRILAYTAVFHFVRQQYGFMRVYSRKEKVSHKYPALIDKVTIYAAALYPIVYWHLSGPKNFNWFVPGDFVFVQSSSLLTIATGFYVMVIAAYLLKEIYWVIKNKTINLPKVLIIVGTILSWYFGIIYFNGDMAFTLLNVVSHGVPYMALVWFYGKKNYSKPERGSKFLKLIFSRYGIIAFVLIVSLFAFIEEAIWDIAVWKEHQQVFGFTNLDFSLNEKLFSLLVPLLALPQITHYILDGFIWKVREDEFKWNSEVRKSQ